MKTYYENAVSIYANSTRVGVGTGDVRISLSVTEQGNDGEFALHDKANINLSVVTAKSLMLQLKSIVESYEEAIGEIPISTDLAEHLFSGNAEFIKNLRNSISIGEPRKIEEKTGKRPK